MPPTPTVTELDPTIFKGLSNDDSDICTVEATVPTGMEDVSTVHLTTLRYWYQKM